MSHRVKAPLAIRRTNREQDTPDEAVSGCCPKTEQATCCEPSDKAACCGPARPETKSGGCGCK